MNRVHLALPDKSGLARLDYYDVPDSLQYPFGAGWMTQVVELFPMRIRDAGGPAFIAAQMIPLLSDALHKMALRPAPNRRTPAPIDRPVWCQLAPEILGFIEQQVPGFHTEGRFGWMDTLREARDLFASHRRNFNAAAKEDVDSFLPLYREVYSEQMTRDDVAKVLRGE